MSTGRVTGGAACNEDQALYKLAWAGVVDQAQIRERQVKMGNGGEWCTRREEARLELDQPTGVTAAKAGQ
jgi:hypothetical protein